ncbi:class I SAM-dependent methyltransferase [Luminiphilus sp.]|nr:class I SAM-dependent methyltransferase [Luminiphilus sp.]
MGQEIDLLKNYPKSKRDITARSVVKTEADREIARQYGKEFFDGDRLYGYGGFNYSPHFWQPVVPDLISHLKLTAKSSLLDVGCAKGFLVFDLLQQMPKMRVEGIDISEYAIRNAHTQVKHLLSVANAKDLPFPDRSFDAVVSINTVHNLNREDCIKALQEIERISKGRSFITVDAYRNKDEKRRMLDWALTARTILHVEDWKILFEEAGYTGDYYWFIP